MVDVSDAVRRGHPISFALLTFWSLIVAIIASALSGSYDNNPENGSQTIKDRVAFLTFTGWWTFLFSIIYIGLFLKGIGGVVTSIAGHGLWLFLTWIFWLAGAASISQFFHGHSCGSVDVPYCNSLKALEAFSWIGWIQLTFMLAVIAFIGGGAFRGGRGLKDSIA